MGKKRRRTTSSIESGESKRDRRTWREPLADAKSQIRLLKMLKSDQASLEELQFLFVTFTLNHAPPFSAISYTWGNSLRPRTVLINGHRCPITSNCHAALIQAYSRWVLGELPSDLIWIDAICIDQDVLSEKNLQVSIMGDIYSSATLTLACIGSHTDDSKYLFDQAGHLHDFPTECNHQMQDDQKPCCMACLQPWASWALGLEENGTERLHCALLAMSKRDYWERIWIVQEVTKAAKVTILCGNSVLLFSLLFKLNDFFTNFSEDLSDLLGRKYPAGRNDQEYAIYNQDLSGYWGGRMDDTLRTRGSPVSLGVMFTRYCQHKCRDNRDRVYGLLSIIEWPRTMSAILPDYSMSAFDLAVQMEPHLTLDQMPSMLASLRVRAEGKWFREALNRRRLDRSSPLGDFDGEKYPDLHARTLYTGAASSWPGCARLEADATGNLAAPLVKKHSNIFKLDETKSLESWTEVDDASSESSSAKVGQQWASIQREHLPQSIELDGAPAMYICKDAQPLDILAPLPSRRGRYLVLRRKNGEIYEIIGLAIMLSGYELGLDDPRLQLTPDPQVFLTQIELHLTAEDATVLWVLSLDPYTDIDFASASETDSIESLGDSDGDAVLIKVSVDNTAFARLIGPVLPWCPKRTSPIDISEGPFKQWIEGDMSQRKRLEETTTV